MDNPIISPLSNEQLDLLSKITGNIDSEQTVWLSGYFAGLASQSGVSVNNPLAVATETAAVVSKELTILYGSRTGNGESLATIVQEQAVEHGLHVHLKSMADYNPKDLQSEKNVLIIVSTHGDGIPPFAARELYEFIHGKRAQQLDGVNYAVLALGDSTYFKFCQTGIDFDEQLNKLGAKRIVDRLACDLDFETSSKEWIQSTLKAFNQGGSKIQEKNAVPQFRFMAAKKETPAFSKKNPYSAAVLDKVYLHGRGSDRQTIHIELDTAEALAYEPGDAAGILPVNSHDIIEAVLSITGIDSKAEVVVNDTNISIYEALYREFELSKITVDVIKRYLEYAKNDKLEAILANQDELREYVTGRDIVDLLEDFPTKVEANDLAKILKPLQPRYYSISSSPKTNLGELHLTVGVVNFEQHGRKKRGACSNYLSEVVVDDEHVPIFIEKNPNFRLPDNDETHIIMVGAGTGIAPYRSFVQHRDASEKKGKSWLFFGNRNFETEFLYQTEWQQFLKTGTLTKLDVAFSRDSEKPVYVQHKIEENAQEIYQWLEDGAHFYICGDMKKMAVDVQNSLVNIVAKHGVMSQESAQEYVDNLQKERRLQLDVY